MHSDQALVTGGGGFLGKAIVKKLLSKGWQVKSFSRGFYPELDAMGVSQIQGDIADISSVEAAFKDGVKTVFHTAARPDLWGPWKDFYQVNVQGTQNVILACEKYRVGQMIHTSSPSVVFGDHDMENADETAPYPSKYLAAYPETKAIAEKMVVQAARQGLNTLILRPHLIWGPGDNHIVPGIIRRAGSLKRVGRADDLVDTIYIDNAADAHVLAAEKLAEHPDLSGNIYFISQGEPVSKWDLANAFLAAAGRDPIRGSVSGQTAYLAGALFETIYRLLRIQTEPPMTRFAAKELATSHWFDISRAKQDLGYVPEISISEGLERLKEWLQTTGLKLYLKNQQI